MDLIPQDVTDVIDDVTELSTAADEDSTDSLDMLDAEVTRDVTDDASSDSDVMDSKRKRKRRDMTAQRGFDLDEMLDRLNVSRPMMRATLLYNSRIYTIPLLFSLSVSPSSPSISPLQEWRSSFSALLLSFPLLISPLIFLSSLPLSLSTPPFPP